MRALVATVACVATLLTGCPRGSGQQELSRLPSLTSDDPQAEADLRAAREASEAGRAAEAEQRYRAFLDDHAEDPLVPAAKLGLGQVLLANGDVEGALAQFTEVAQSDDLAVSEAGRFYQGVALHLDGRHAEAVELLEPLAGRTTDPSETVLLLRTLSAAATETGDAVLALGALDQLVGSEAVPDEDREAARGRIRELVAQADAESVQRAYETLPRSGAAWPQVAVRAIRLAFDAGDMTRVAEMVADLRERDVPMTDELAELAVRAERTERADPRVIGAILPLTGRGREVGQRAMRGMMLAAGNPADGPPDPNAPQLVLRDDAGNPERAAQAVEDLVSEHRAVAIIGPLEGAAARAAAARAQDLGVPLLTLVPDPQVTERGAMVFRLFPAPDDEIRALVTAAFERGARRFAVLAPSHAYGRAMTEAYGRAVSAAGGEVVASETYDAGATAFGESITRLGTDFDALLLPDSARQVQLIAPALAAAGLWSVPAGGSAPRNGQAITVLAPSVAVDARLAQSAGRYLSGALFASPYHAASASGAGAAFADAFRARFSAEPDTFAAYGYDAFRLIRRAVEAGETTRGGVARWLTAAPPSDTVGASAGINASRGPQRGTRLLELRDRTFVAATPPGSS